MVKTIEAILGVTAMKKLNGPSKRQKTLSAAKRSTDRGSDEDAIVDLLHRASQVVEALFYREAGLDGLTVRQHAIAVAIANSGQSSQTDVCLRTGIDRSTLAEVMRRMVSKGMVLRRRTRHDARRYELKLTTKGQAALQASALAAGRIENFLGTVLSIDERKQLIALLRRVAAARKG